MYLDGSFVSVEGEYAGQQSSAVNIRDKTRIILESLARPMK